jgi:hypothetical protein
MFLVKIDTSHSSFIFNRLVVLNIQKRLYLLKILSLRYNFIENAPPLNRTNLEGDLFPEQG